MATSKSKIGLNTQGRLTFSPADFLASRSVKSENGEAKKMPVGCGRNIFELSERSSLPWWLLRTFLIWSGWGSTRFSMIWKAKGIGHNRLLFQLHRQEAFACEIEFGSL